MRKATAGRGPKRYRVVAVGGTFDPLHRGHDALLGAAFRVAEHVLIGITSDPFAQKLGKQLRRPYGQRVAALRRSLRRTYPKASYEIRPLYDYFGPGVFTVNVEALVVSEETLPRVEEANQVRRSHGLPPLETVVVPMVLAEDGTRISSTRIRADEIDTEGRVRKKRSWQRGDT